MDIINVLVAIVSVLVGGILGAVIGRFLLPERAAPLTVAKPSRPAPAFRTVVVEKTVEKLARKPETKKLRRLSVEKINYIQEQVAAGRSKRSIAVELGISWSNVDYWCKRRPPEAEADVEPMGVPQP